MSLAKWHEDGVDDENTRMYDLVAEKFASEEAQLRAHQEKKGQEKANSVMSQLLEKTGFFGRQRQVQHLREKHRVRMEELRREKVNDELSDDDEHEIIKKRKQKSDQQQQQQRERFFLQEQERRKKKKLQGEEEQSGNQKKQQQQQQKRTIRFSAATPQPSTKTATGGNNNNTSSFYDREEFQQQQQQQQTPKSYSALGGGVGGGSCSTPATSILEEAPTFLDIGSEKMPLRFFPDQRAGSGWRGVVRPLTEMAPLPLNKDSSSPSSSSSINLLSLNSLGGINKRSSNAATSSSTGSGGAAAAHRIRSLEQQRHLAQQEKLREMSIEKLRIQERQSSNSKTPEAITALLAKHDTKRRSSVLGNSDNSLSQQPQQQQQQHATSSMLKGGRGRTTTPTSNNNNHIIIPQTRASHLRHHLHLHHSPSPVGLHQDHSQNHFFSSSSFDNHSNYSTTGSGAGGGRAVSNSFTRTFSNPTKVPSSHKQRNANPIQDGISKALPKPLGDVDVAVLAPRSQMSYASSPEQNTRGGFNKMYDVLADVRMVVLDNVHHNFHRIVQRQLDRSPERLPSKARDEERKMKKGGKINNNKKKVGFLHNNNNNNNNHDEQQEDEDADQNNNNNLEASLSSSAASGSSSMSVSFQNLEASTSSSSGSSLSSTTTKRNNSRKVNLSASPDREGRTRYTDDSDDDDLDDEFVSVADEQVIVGGDVIGGSPLLLPKMKGRWDAMRDAIKSRYFSKPAPPVEAIGHALRIIPLAELCSMYRRCVKEVKGALEMTRKIFDQLVKVMLAVLPGSPSVTEAEYTKYYYIFDMNGNGSISFIEFLTTVVDFQTDRKETDFLRSVFDKILIASGNQAAVEAEDLSARAPWTFLEDPTFLLEQILRALGKSARFPRVVEKTFADCLAISFRNAHTEAESALCQESFDGLFWEQFRLLVCLDPELIVPLRTLKL